MGLVHVEAPSEDVWWPSIQMLCGIPYHTVPPGAKVIHQALVKGVSQITCEVCREAYKAELVRQALEKC